MTILAIITSYIIKTARYFIRDSMGAYGSFFYFDQQIANIRTLRPSARVTYGPSRGSLRTKYFTPTAYSQPQEQRRKLLPQPKEPNQQMNDEKELAKALALLALPNR